MALRCGIPSLVIPFGYDQPDNGARMERLGVARVVPRHRLTARVLVKGLRTMLEEDGMKSRARCLARRIDPETDMRRSVEAIENAAKSRKSHCVG